MDTSERKSSAESAIAKLLNESSGFELSELDRRASFPELGFDSLFLVQFSQKIKSQLKVRITFRQLMEEVTNIDALINHVSAHLPDNLVDSTQLRQEAPVVPAAPTHAPTTEASDTARINATPTDDNLVDAVANETPPPAPVVVPSPEEVPLPSNATSIPAFQLPTVSAGSVSDKDALAQIISQQNQLMSIQLQLLAGSAPSQSSRRVDTAPQNPVPSRSHSVAPPPTPPSSSVAGIPASTPSVNGQEKSSAGSVPGHNGQVTAKVNDSFERFGPFKPVRRAADGGLTEHQQRSLDALIARFIKRTSKSRAHAQLHRPNFADPRGVAGYRRIWKSMVYQIAVERSKGSKLWDIDGNEYIDIAMGFGLNLFGQSPDFVTDALRKQLGLGVEVGPQSPLAGDVAQLLCDFSRMDRVTFCNTGSEAVMAAMRLARTVTGKSKIVFFNKDYHGNFDQVLVRSSQIGQQRRSQPAAPGVPQSFADNAIVLDYGTEQALQVIQERADEIAAVLVEPVQSADPSMQPREFLHEVRRITKERQIAMIMDEVITGFRAAPGGAQEWFDVWADMATYGKILGGGLPIGALAGSATYMDALDGGDWKYEDQSEPDADMTFFAGTFVRHPLAIASAHQVLMQVKELGPELQKGLTEKTTYLVNSLNEFFQQELFPIRVAQFTSLFRFMFPPTLEFADLLYFHLLDRGIFTRGWGDNCFLSTAHTDEDVEKIIRAVKDSCQEIRSGDFMPKPDSSSEPESTGIALKNSRNSAPGSKSEEANPEQPQRQDRLSTVEEIQEEGELPPLFCMPAADGLTLVFHELAKCLGDDQPVYGLNSPGAYGEEVPETIEEMATRFIEDIKEVQQHGPYLLMGYCSGGSIAFEVAQQLEAEGEKVAFVCGVETYDWGTAQSSNPTLWVKIIYQIQRLEFHFRNFLLLDFKNQYAHLRSKLGRLKSRTAVWRGKFASLFAGKKRKKVPSRHNINWNDVWRQHDAQADRYIPKPYPGKLLLIRPRKDYRSYVGKNDLVATGGVTIVRIPAFPSGLMTPPYVSQVADLVGKNIQEGLRECGLEVSQPCRLPGENQGAHQVAPVHDGRLVNSPHVI